MEFTGRRRAVALALGLLLPLAACSNEIPDSPGTSPGDVIEARNVGLETGKRSIVLTPAGRLVVRFGDPVPRLERDQTSDLTSRTAPEGGSFVPVVWSFQDDIYGEIERLFGERRALEVELVAGGERYSLSPPDPGSNKTAEYVAVEGAADELTLEVTYDGLTQTVDAETGERESGVAEALYGLPETEIKIKKCPIKKWFTDPTILLAYECQYTTAVPSPYVANTWVKEGHTWLSVTVATNLVRYAVGELNGSIASYEIDKNVDLSTIDGRKPVGTLRDKANGGVAVGTMVFNIKGELPDTLQVRRRYQLSLNGAVGEIKAPQRKTVEIGGEIKLVY